MRRILVRFIHLLSRESKTQGQTHEEEGEEQKGDIRLINVVHTRAKYR